MTVSLKMSRLLPWKAFPYRRLFLLRAFNEIGSAEANVTLNLQFDPVFNCSDHYRIQRGDANYFLHTAVEYVND